MPRSTWSKKESTDLSLRFPKSHRLSGRKAFDAVFEAKVRKGDSRVLLYARANGLAHSRLGLSIPRRAGNAPVRNRLKRLVREAYRLQQHDLPRGFDWVAVIRARREETLEGFHASLAALAAELTRRLSGGGEAS
jgi:ribonuclease P protein component